MSAPVRFLALLVVGWAGVRAATLGMIPGFTVSYAKPLPRSEPPPVIATEFAALPPVEPAFAQELAGSSPFAYPAMAPVPVAYYPAYPAAYSYPYPVASPPPPIPPRPQWQLPSARAAETPDFYSPLPSLDSWTLPPMTSAAFPAGRSTPAPMPSVAAAARPRLDRWQLSSWALLRGSPGPGALASGGTLGGSQAGARLTYAFNPMIAASLRTSSPVGGSRGAEVAGGIRVIPFRSIPLAITAERRQAISPNGGGRSAFAVFVEGGLYRQPMPLRFSLDAYVQAGVVGLNSRDYFADGAFAFTRPVWGRFSAGFGVWGGVQPGIYRIDAGPRISMRIRDNIHAHADWRQRLVGNAEPASGPALTLTADF